MVQGISIRLQHQQRYKSLSSHAYLTVGKMLKGISTECSKYGTRYIYFHYIRNKSPISRPYITKANIVQGIFIMLQYQQRYKSFSSHPYLTIGNMLKGLSTECSKIYLKSVLHCLSIECGILKQLQYRFAVNFWTLSIRLYLALATL